ncbi:MAG: vWA domain-containing protein [Pirellulaceae bacterium]
MASHNREARSRNNHVPTRAESPPPRGIPPRRNEEELREQNSQKADRTTQYAAAGSGLFILCLILLAIGLRGGLGNGKAGSGIGGEPTVAEDGDGSGGTGLNGETTGNSGDAKAKGDSGKTRNEDEVGGTAQQDGNTSATGLDEQITTEQHSAAAEESTKEHSRDQAGRATDLKPPPLPTANVPSFNTFSGIGIPSGPSTNKGEEAGEGDGVIEFFGVEGKGSKIVFVIDMSGSMVGYRFDKAREELMASVMRLHRDQSFCVLLFHSEMVVPMSAKLIHAQAAAKKSLRRALTQVQAFDGTDPTSAIQAAISLRPDVIYVLSDGEFEYGTTGRVTEMNRDSGIVINTIGFQVDADTLRQVAKENRGEYRFVP